MHNHLPSHFPVIEADGVNVAKDRSRCYGYVCFIARVVFLQSFTAGQSSA